MEPEPTILLDGSRGIYLPQRFAERFRPVDHPTYMMYPGGYRVVTPDDPELWADLLLGPDHPHYWDAWDDVLETARLVDDHGQRYFLATSWWSGDLWAIPEGWEWDDREEWFVPPREGVAP